MADQMLEELPVVQQCRPIAATRLVPLMQPEQRNDFLFGKAILNKRVSFRFDRLHMCFHILFSPLCICDRLCLPEIVLFLSLRLTGYGKKAATT